MSDESNKSVRSRRRLVRSILVAVYLGLMGFVFVFGKGHTILVDNKDIEGTDLVGFEDVTVGVDTLEPVELLPGDRDMFKIKGQRHKVILEILGQEGKIVKTIKLPLKSDMVLLSLPKLAAGVEPYLEPFSPRDMAPPPQDTESFSSDVMGLTADPIVDPKAEAAPSPAPAP